VKNITWYRGS